MIFAVLLLIICLVIVSVMYLCKMNIRTVLIVLLPAVFLASIGLCVAKPVMHKQFSIDIVEYIMKINDDGSMTTTKQVTRTMLKKEQKDLKNNEKDF